MLCFFIQNELEVDAFEIVLLIVPFLRILSSPAVLVTFYTAQNLERGAELKGSNTDFKLAKLCCNS